MGLTPRLAALPVVETWSRRRIAWIGGLFIAAIVALAAYDMLRSYRETVALAARELDTQARVIAEQTTRSLQAVDTVLRHLAEQHRRGVLQRLSPDELHAYLKEQAVGLVQVDGLVVFGPDGLGRGSSVVPPAAVGKIDVRRLETYHRLREEATIRMMVGTTIRAPGTGRRVFPIGRRLDGANGEFLGVVGAGGQVEYFQRFYSDAYPDTGTRIALLHRNTTLMARHPAADEALGRRFPLFAELLKQANAGSHVSRTADPLDGADRFVAVRVVPDHPLVVMVTRDAARVLAPWRAQAIGSALRTLALGALATLLLALLWRQLNRLGAARASLAQSEQRYALAAAGSDTGVWDWDLVAGTAFESRRARELQGLPLAPETQPLAELQGLLMVHPDDTARRDAALQAHLDGRTPHYEVEYRVRRRHGADDRFAWVHVRALCTRDDEGRPLRLAGSVSDIDDRKQQEAERERLEQQLRQAQKLEAIGTLAGGIAHDFNNILSAILGYGDLALKGAAEGSPQRRHIDAALAAGQRAKSLVERILAFSRSGMGERVPVHVQSVVAEALDSIAATLPPGVVLERQLHAGDAAVQGDPTQIHQVVMNLCANAAQAMRGEGRLAVSLEPAQLAAPQVVATSTLAPGAYLRLAVADSGSGIEPALLPRIFDPFFTTKEVGVGTGLGLSLVHGIVTDLGGGIDVSSRVGAGSTFTVYLPAAAAATAPPPVGATQAELPQGSGQVVLLVDDEEPLVRLNEELLASLGYEPVGFVTSAAALAALRAEPQRFDLLLSDEAMSGLTGSELAAQARRLRPDLPVLLMTGFASAALQQRARAAGVAEVLAKPLAAAELARALAAQLQR